MAVDFFWDGTAAPANTTPSTGNSDGASGPAMSSVAVAAGDSITYTDFPGFLYGRHIGMSLIAAGAGATRCLWAASEVVGTRICVCFDYAVTPGFSQIEDVCGFRHSSGNLAILQIGADGKIIPSNAAGTGLSAFKAAVPIEASVLCRIGLAITPGTTSTNGRIEWAYWEDPDTGGTPTLSGDTGATVNVGTNQATANVFIGRSTGRAQAHEPYYGLIQVKSLASGWPDPLTATIVNPLARLNGDQLTIEPFDTVTLDAGGSEAYNGATISTYSFTQLTGTSVGTLSGSGSVRTYKAPGASADSTVTFRVTVTDSNGNTDTADVTHTILRANEYAPISSTLQPLNID